jgi:hypothetical protein
MIRETIASAGIESVILDSITAAIYIRPSPDADIHLEHSAERRFHVEHVVEGGVLRVTAELEWSLINLGPGPVLRLYLPDNLIKRLEIMGSASYVNFAGKDGMLESCQIDVTAAAVYLENIYADTKVQTLSGAIRLKNDTIRSNIRLETQVGVIDMTLREVPDDVSVRASSILPLPYGARDRVSSHERYAVTAESRVGIVHVH